MRKRILSILLSLVVTLSFLPISNLTTLAAESPVYVGFTSDVHGNTTALGNWFDNLPNDVDLTNMGYCGDYSYKTDSNGYLSEFNTVYSLTNTKVDQNAGVYTTGNHDYQTSALNTMKETTGFVRLGEATNVRTPAYKVYGFGASDGDATGKFVTADIQALDAYLRGVPSTTPVFILSHYPLHCFSFRTITKAKDVIDVLNKYPNAVFVWGHNHSQGDSHYGEVKSFGDEIEYKSGSKEKINFTYVSAGSVYSTSQTRYGGVTVGVDGTKMSFDYYEVNGNKLTAKNRTTVDISEGSEEDEPTVDTEITVTPTANPVETTTATVRVGEELKVKINNEGSQKYTFTTTVADTGVATASPASVEIAKDETGVVTVTGLKKGETKVTIKNNNQFGSVRQTVITLKVLEEGEDDPETEEITATPHQIGRDGKGAETINKTIKVGDELIVHVKNDSSSNAYDFAATSGDTGIATVSPASQNIAAGAIKDYTIKGVAKGNTTVTFANDNPSGSQYDRKTIINLTVEEDDPAEIYYDVTFDMKGHGTQVPAQKVKAGEKATEPDDPTAEGYTFVDWYEDGTFIKAFDFNTAITKNTTIYAKWTEVEPTGKVIDVTPDTQNKTVDAVIYEGEKLTVRVKNGSSDNDYDFTTTVPEAGREIVEASPTEVNIEHGKTEDVVLTGLKKGETTVKIANGSSSGSRKINIHLYVLEEGEILATPSQIGKDGTGAETIDATIHVGDELTVIVKNESTHSGYTYAVGVDKTSVASAEPASVTIAKSGTEDVTVTGLTEGKAKITIRNNNTKDGADKERITYINLTVEDPAKTYDVTFDMNGHGTQVEKKQVKAGEKVTEPTPAPTDDYWTFGGWYANADCTEPFDFSTPITGNTTLYAKWTEIEYTVTFDVGEHGTAPKSQTVKKGGKATRPEEDPSEEGWEFEGWFKEGLETEFNFNTETINADTTVYAKWTADTPPAPTTYKVTFNMNGHGTQEPEQQVTKGGNATKPADPKAEGWTFGGWYANAICTVPFDFDTQITADTTVYAKWTENVEPEPKEPENEITVIPQKGGEVKDATIYVGEELVIHVTNGSEHGNTYWFATTVEDSNIASASPELVLIRNGRTKDVVVKGLEKGTTQIKISNRNTLFGEGEERYTIINLKVAEPEIEPEPTPITGDSNRMFTWLALLFVSGGLFAGIIIYDKKSKKVE